MCSWYCQLPIEVSEYNVELPWFATVPDLDKVTAYTQLISALCKMSKDQKRISATESRKPNKLASQNWVVTYILFLESKLYF